MPSDPAKKAHNLEDYGEFLSALTAEGFDFLVIGGCAVGAYAHLRGITLFSGDLDLYTDRDTLNRVLEWAPKHGIDVVKRPQPRAIPVAFLLWQGMEVNILSSSDGLPEPEEAVRVARAFRLEKQGLEVLVADPFDLLQNKLRVNRPKDQPHLEILRGFVEEEIVAAFEAETTPRERLAPARRWLHVTRSRTLSEKIAARLVPLAKTPADFRFLVNNVPSEKLARAALERARTQPELFGELEAILEHREFP